MQRRDFLRLVGGGTLVAACGHAVPGPPRTQRRDAIRAVAFDLLAIFDPRGIDARVAHVLPDAGGFATSWKDRLFEYCWIRASAGRYAPFDQLVLDALDDTARASHIELRAAARDELASVFTELDPWPDAAPVLGELRARGLRIAPLTNFAPDMIRTLVERAGLHDLFERQLSTDLAATYKPDPRAYALAETGFELSRSEIAFVAFAGWDAAGARWYGYPTFWLNRAGAPMARLIEPDASGADLRALLRWSALGYGPDRG